MHSSTTKADETSLSKKPSAESKIHLSDQAKSSGRLQDLVEARPSVTSRSFVAQAIFQHENDLVSLQDLVAVSQLQFIDSDNTRLANERACFQYPLSRVATASRPQTVEFPAITRWMQAACVVLDVVAQHCQHSVSRQQLEVGDRTIRMGVTAGEREVVPDEERLVSGNFAPLLVIEEVGRGDVRRLSALVEITLPLLRSFHEERSCIAR